MCQYWSVCVAIVTASLVAAAMGELAWERESQPLRRPRVNQDTETGMPLAQRPEPAGRRQIHVGFPHRETADVETSVRDGPSPTAATRLFHEELLCKQVKTRGRHRLRLNHSNRSLGTLPRGRRCSPMVFLAGLNAIHGLIADGAGRFLSTSGGQTKPSIARLEAG